MILTVQNIMKETPEAVTVSFKNGNLFNKLKYFPGQFIQIDFKIGKDTVRRSYAFSSSPSVDKDLRITIKKTKGGYVSNYVNNILKIGDKVSVNTPMGSFYIETNPENKNTYILMAGGIGIAPILSIIKSVLTDEPDSKILLIYANQDKESIIFFRQLESLKQKHYGIFFVEHILSENTNPDYHTGFLTEGLLDVIFRKYDLKFDEHKYMMCGPSGFMDHNVSILNKKGITRDKIKLEAFKIPNIQISRNKSLSNVTLKYKDEVFNFDVPDDKTILQVAMNNNVVLPYSCRTAKCNSCKGKCTEGKVTMNKGHLLTDEQITNGEILTCISYPSSSKISVEIGT